MTVATAIALASLAVSAYGASEQQKAGKMGAEAQGKAAQSAANEQYTNAELAKLDAARIQKQAGIEAQKIREVAIQMRGQQESVQAVSGAMVGSGSNQIMTEDTTKRAEADALAVVIEGIYGTVNKESSARYMTSAGQATLLSGGLAAAATERAGNASAVATMGQGVVSAYSNYRMWAPKQETTATAATTATAKKD